MIIDSILQNPIVSIIGIIGGIASVIGIPLAIIIPKQREKHKPKYAIFSKTIRKKDFTKNTFVKIQSKGKEVPVLTISKIAFWNNGASLQPSDIAPNAPICIKTNNDEVKILEIQEIFSEDKNNIRNIQISEDSKSVTFDFDFLAKNDGFVLDVFHTGDGSKDIEVCGSLINGERVTKLKRVIKPYSKNRRWNKIMIIVFGLLTLICTLGIIIRFDIDSGFVSILIGYDVVFVWALIQSILRIIPPLPKNLANYYLDEMKNNI